MVSERRQFWKRLTSLMTYKIRCVCVCAITFCTNNCVGNATNEELVRQGGSGLNSLHLIGVRGLRVRCEGTSRGR